VLVDKQVNNVVIVVVEPNDVENAQMAWGFIVIGGATFTMGEVVSTLKTNDQRA